MTAQKNGGVWKAVALVSLTANITGVSAWLAFTDRDAITRTELEKELAKIPPPQVKAHIEDKDIHERDGTKRARTREELQLALEPIRIRLDAIDKKLERLDKQN